MDPLYHIGKLMEGEVSELVLTTINWVRRCQALLETTGTKWIHKGRNLQRQLGECPPACGRHHKQRLEL